MRETISLDGQWKLSFYGWNCGEAFQPWHKDFDDSGWLPANVPGDVHLDLMNSGKIPDPFWGRNAELCRWVENVDWWYRKNFRVNKSSLNRPAILSLDGLDCFATIYLNGEEIGKHEDMFVECELNVTGKLKAENTLAVKLASPIKSVEDKDITALKGSNHEQRVYARKCQMSYGWNFAPHLLTAGIWKIVRIELLDTVQFEDLCLRSTIIDDTTAEVNYEITIRSAAQAKQKLVIQISGTPENFEGKGFSQETAMDLEPQGIGIVTGKITVKDARLWFPHTLGDPNLYNVRVEALADSKLLDRKTIRYGLRKVEIVQRVEDQENPHRFYFVINGRPVFAKGANWVPPDALVARVTREKRERLLHLAKAANMNFIRVWGGGTPESDVFYDLCDELGILVWQEFNFACSDYPEDTEFTELIRYEVEKIVKRLRNRTSLVMWCGSNETLWENQYGASLFYVTIRDVCQRLDPTRVYRYSSPYGGYWPNAPEEGTEHFWYVWLGFKPYRYYAQNRGCFVSEFGMQGPPHLKTWQSCFVQEQLSPQAVQNEMTSDTPAGAYPSLVPECTAFQYHDFQTDRFQLYLQEFGEVKTFEDFINLGQLMQATAVKYAVEHFRRRKYNCGGSLYWQLNDVWPATSWAAIDYYLRPKMLYYFTKRFYMPVLVSFKEELDAVSVWFTNDLPRTLNGKLVVTLEKFTGEKIWQKQVEAEIESDVSKCLLEIPSGDLPNAGVDDVFLWACLEDEEGGISENVRFLTEHRNLRLPTACISLKENRIDNDFAEITIATDIFARLVTIEIEDEVAFVEDNFFDLRAKKSHIVRLTWPMAQKPSKLVVCTLAWNAKPYHHKII
jgi:beta-mannosidase